MQITELSPVLGAEVAGVDLRTPLGAAQVDELRATYERHHLLVLHDQDLSGEQQVAFASHFGPLVIENAAWGYVSNVRPDGIVREGALLFHSDFAFAREPTRAISLHALEVPDDGAPTLFASAVRAAARLPVELRSQLEGRDVLNIYDFGWPDDTRVREHQLAPGSPRSAHPALGRHPVLDVAVPYANRMHTDRVIGLAEERSEALLDALFGVLYADDNIYEHRWRVGDVVLWDNVALHHGRRDIPLDQPRTLQRVALGRHTPTELVPNLAQLLGRA